MYYDRGNCKFFKKYEGEFQKNKYHGYGIEYDIDFKNTVGVKKYEGKFEHGLYQGHGILYSMGTKIYEGEFENGIIKHA